MPITSDKVIYVLGNPLIEEDKKPVELIPALSKAFQTYSFIHIDPTEGFPVTHSGKCTIIDTVIGIENVTVYSDLESFIVSPRMTVHDFDIPLELGMMKKLGKLKEITVIGIPVGKNKAEILKQLRALLH